MFCIQLSKSLWALGRWDNTWTGLTQYIKHKTSLVVRCFSAAERWLKKLSSGAPCTLSWEWLSVFKTKRYMECWKYSLLFWSGIKVSTRGVRLTFSTPSLNVNVANASRTRLVILPIVSSISTSALQPYSYKDLSVSIGDDVIGRSYDRYSRNRGVRVNSGAFSNAY